MTIRIVEPGMTGWVTGVARWVVVDDSIALMITSYDSGYSATRRTVCDVGDRCLLSVLRRGTSDGVPPARDCLVQPIDYQTLRRLYGVAMSHQHRRLQRANAMLQSHRFQSYDEQPPIPHFKNEKKEIIIIRNGPKKRKLIHFHLPFKRTPVIVTQFSRYTIRIIQ